MKTFRVRQVYKILFLALILLFLGLMVFLMYTMGSLTTSLVRTVERTASIRWTPALLCATPFLLLTVWYLVYLAAFYKMHLIFDSEKITLESIKHFRFLLPAGYKSFELPYDQIKKVKLEGFINRALLTNQGGKKVVLFPGLFSKNHGAEILTELRNRLPTESFEPGMETPTVLGIWSKQNKIRTAFFGSILVLYIATMFLDPIFSSRSWLTNDWDVKLDPRGYESVWAYSTDSKNTFWVISWKSSYYRVYHFSDKVENEWMLPKDLLGEKYPNQVSSDNAGNPIVWTEKGIYRYEDNDWKWIPYLDSPQIENWFRGGVASGKQVWTLNKLGQILKINALTGTWLVLDLPASALERNLQPKSMRRTVQGDIMVLMQNDNTSYVYLLSMDDTWKSQEFSIIASQNISIRDYFLDDHNALWVLSKEQNKFFVQKINLKGDLLLMQLPSPLETEDWERYSSLLVDSSGRLWVEGGYPYFMAVFSPVWNDTAKEIVRYTKKNSAFQDDTLASPILMSDGRIWSFDEWISTMDTHLTKLPSPLPAWFASWDWGLIRIGGSLIQLLGMLVFYLLSVKPTLFQKRTPAVER